LKLPWRPFAGNMLVVARNPTFTPSVPRPSHPHRDRISNEKRSSQRHANTKRRISSDSNRKDAGKDQKQDIRQTAYNQDEPMAPVSVLKDGHRTRAKPKKHGSTTSGNSHKSRSGADKTPSTGQNASRTQRSRRVNHSDRTKSKNQHHRKSDGSGGNA